MVLVQRESALTRRGLLTLAGWDWEPVAAHWLWWPWRRLLRS